jgi:predicted Zn-dependent protease
LINLQATRGDVLARLGREAEAEEAFRGEIHDFPENLDAWSRLALLYASAGQRDQSERLLAEMVGRIPASRSFEAAARVAEILGDRAAAQRWRGRAEAARR